MNQLARDTISRFDIDIEEVLDDFVTVDGTTVLTNGTKWTDIMTLLALGYTVYHRYDMDDDPVPAGRRRISMEGSKGVLKKDLRRLYEATVQPKVREYNLIEGPMLKELNEIPLDGDDSLNPYYFVVTTKSEIPENNIDALHLLRKNHL